MRLELEARTCIRLLETAAPDAMTALGFLSNFSLGECTVSPPHLTRLIFDVLMVLYLPVFTCGHLVSCVCVCVCVCVCACACACLFVFTCLSAVV